MIFARHVVETQMYIAHRDFDVGVPHEFLHDRERHALPNHVGTEGVAELVRIGGGEI